MGDSPETDETVPTASELEAEGQSAMFGDVPPAAAPAATGAAQPYRVLARKYRPQTFAELIGQDAMVQTLANAIRRERLAHAFLMTGVRGVGKTSTARLIAKALNCVGPDGEGGATIDSCGQCEPCIAIAEGRHIDVIEMDAASHTGIDDVREIIEAVRYAAVSARYKMYIIDEAHMLSKQAWNGLLKTLEEPPPHVKFLFATTEVDKVPVTVLSRTQRFDLLRIPSALLQDHFAQVCTAEGVTAEDEALGMIAAAAEGSVRDGLSILDQAIAHADLESGGKVTADRVRDMLGLADKGALRRLFTSLLDGDALALIDAMEAQHALGVEPLALLRGLMDLVHRIAVARIARNEPDAVSAEERAALADWGARLSHGQVHRLWQLLLKGHDEVRQAPDPHMAAQMALLRMLHAAELPDPGKLAELLGDLAARGPVASAATEGTPASGGENAAAPDWAELVAQVDASGQLRVAQIMRDWVQVVELAPGRLVYSLVEGFSGDPAPDLRDGLLKATGARWEVIRGEGGAPSLREQEGQAREDAAARLRAHPLVEATFAAFPGAEIIDENGADGQGGYARDRRA